MEHYKYMADKAILSIMLMATPFIDILEQWVRISAGLLGCVLTIYMIRQGILNWKIKQDERAIRKIERQQKEDEFAEYMKNKYLSKS